MKRILVLLPIVAVAGLLIYTVAVNRPASRKPVLPGFKAPDFSLLDLDGSAWRLADGGGVVTFINFWATWCKECREEMPSIQSLHEKTRDNPGFRLLSVLYRDDPETARRYMLENGYTFPVLLDPGGGTAYAYGLTGVPETFIVDGKGYVARKTIGPDTWDAPEIVAQITGLIASSAQ